MQNKSSPRVSILSRDVERAVIRPFEKYGWEANITHINNQSDIIEVFASKLDTSVRYAFIYSTAISNQIYKLIDQRCDVIFYTGQPYRIDEYAYGISTPIEPLDNFFPYLIELNREIEPAAKSQFTNKKYPRRRRINDENPQTAILNWIEQYRSIYLCKKLIKRRAEDEGFEISAQKIESKAQGVAYSIQNALEYFLNSNSFSLNQRILSLYYGAMSFASAEMISAPNGIDDLDEIEAVTKFGHGIYALSNADENLTDIKIGTLSNGFLPRWLNSIGYDVSGYPRKRPKNLGDLSKISDEFYSTFGFLMGAFPECGDLYSSITGEEHSWLFPTTDLEDNGPIIMSHRQKKSNSTYIKLIDHSAKMTPSRIINSNLPIAELKKGSESNDEKSIFLARIDHIDFDYWWEALLIHRSPIGTRTSIILPPLAGIAHYRVLSFAALYALSIAVRYMPGMWRKIEGGENDQYLALIKAALHAWERLLPQEFIQNIANEEIIASQPGSFFS